MEIVFSCPHCKSKIEADSEISGVRAQCPACDEMILVPAQGIEIGMELAGFRIEKQIGVGGMGEVFLATQVSMERKVALKVLPPGVTNNKIQVDRFIHEFKMAGMLEHTNIVTAYDAGREGEHYYMAMSYVEGVDLLDRIKESPIPEKEALNICLKMAQALGYAWNKHQMLHRDIKPANIMIDTEGEVKLMDMGIAKSMDEDSGLTIQGSLVGTPYYMSPEQATANAQLDCRADIYSLGASFYHMLTQERPYQGPNSMAVIAKHLSENERPAPISDFVDVASSTAAIVDKMMQKNAADRYQNYTELESDLENAIAGRPLSFAISADSSLLGADEEIGLKKKTPSQVSFDDTTATPPLKLPDKAADHVDIEAPQLPAINEPEYDIEEWNDDDHISLQQQHNLRHKSNVTMLFFAVIAIILIFGAVVAIIALFKYFDAQNQVAVIEKENEGLRLEVETDKSLQGFQESRLNQKAKKEEKAAEGLRELEQYEIKNPNDFQTLLKRYKELAPDAKETRYENDYKVAIVRLEKKSRSHTYLKGTWRTKSSTEKFVQLIIDRNNNQCSYKTDKFERDGHYSIKGSTIQMKFTDGISLALPYEYDSSNDNLKVKLKYGAVTLRRL